MPEKRNFARQEYLPEGQWVYGEPHTIDCPIPHIHTVDVGKQPVDKETISQFTGLYDYNCKEIYEGDIIEDKEYKYKHLIRYSNNKACFTATLVKYVGDDINESFWECDVTQRWINECGKEVIGNIYDNKELLTQN